MDLGLYGLEFKAASCIRRIRLPQRSQSWTNSKPVGWGSRCLIPTYRAETPEYINEEEWLKWLDYMAVKYDKRRPDHLFLLREYGARTSSELSA